MSLPTRERGLKLKRQRYNPRITLSLPTRERGLKHCRQPLCNSHERSLPTRERGLKHSHVGDAGFEVWVAPHAGAWIETQEYADYF